MPIYRDTVIPLADVITPNQFEAEYVFSSQCIMHLSHTPACVYVHTYICMSYGCMCVLYISVFAL